VEGFGGGGGGRGGGAFRLQIRHPIVVAKIPGS
jgi:hypothetical protein